MWDFPVPFRWGEWDIPLPPLIKIVGGSVGSHSQISGGMWDFPLKKVVGGPLYINIPPPVNWWE